MAKTLKSPDLSTIIPSLQTPYVFFAADDPAFTVIEQNVAHAQLTRVRREHVVGKPLREVFSRTSQQFQQAGMNRLIESLRKVIRTKRSDSMPVFKYDIDDTDGGYRTKFWRITHHPIVEDGRVVAICQETHDITDEIDVVRQRDQVQHKLEQVLVNSGIGTWLWNLGDDVVTAGPNLSRMFGVDPAEAGSGLPVDVFLGRIHPDDRQRVEALNQAAIKTGKPYEAEFRLVIDGQTKWVISRGQVQRDAGSGQGTFSGIVIDITDRKLTERALQSSEKRLRFMADSMPQLVWIARADGYTEYFNRPWYDYTGSTPEQSIGTTNWTAFVHPEDRQRAAKAWKLSLKTGDPYEVEYRLFNEGSRSYRWNIGRGLPFRDETGDVVKWYGTCTDIHEQRHNTEVQQFLAHLSKELSTTLDNTKMLRKVTNVCVPSIADWCSIDLIDGDTFKQVSIAHADRRKLATAKEYRARNPINPGDSYGVANVTRTGETEYYPHISDELLAQYIKDPDRLAFMKSLRLHSIIIAPLRINDTPVGGISFVLADSDRHYDETDRATCEELAARVSLAMTNSQLYAESQRDIKARAKLEAELRLEQQKLESRVHDRTAKLQETNEGLRAEITKRQAVERELKANSEELARSNAELEDFAYVASHDLQEPLRKIQAFSDLLTSEYKDRLGDGTEYVERMNSAALRMSTLIQDLLSFSRVTTSESRHRPVALTEVVQEVLLDLETSIEECGGRVVIGPLPTIIADPTHMRQLFQNLIGNALKFHKPGEAPVVEVRAKRLKSRLELTVADNGIGFDEKYLDRIFAVFQRLHGRESYDGTGIGLAVCRKIVERYDGTITARSKKGHGTTFIVGLPRSKEAKT